HHLDDLRLRQRRHVVLQSRQLRRDLGRDQVGARGEDLSELGKRRPELLERLPQPRRAVASALAEIEQSVLGDDGRDPGRPRGQVPTRELGQLLLRLQDSFPRTGSAVLTITTVQRAMCDTRFGMFPSRNSRRPLMPRLPTTSTSTRSDSAAATIAAAGSSPSTTTARAPGTTSSTYRSSSAIPPPTWRPPTSASYRLPMPPPPPPPPPPA